MRLLFDELDMRVIAISRDTPEIAAAHAARDRLKLELWSDPKLEVIAAFGLLHDKALAFTAFTVFGIPMGWPRGRDRMAIPTTIVVDRQGVVRWIDQATDYRLRADERRLHAALRQLFPS